MENETSKNNETEALNKAHVISRLQGLKKWDCSTGDSGPFASQIDWEEDEKYGEWIRKKDVEELIKEFQANGL